MTSGRQQLWTGNPSLDKSSGPTGPRSAPATGANYDPRQQRQDITERMNAATADVSHYRVVALADLVKERFRGEPVCGAQGH